MSEQRISPRDFPVVEITAELRRLKIDTPIEDLLDSDAGRRSEVARRSEVRRMLRSELRFELPSSDFSSRRSDHELRSEVAEDQFWRPGLQFGGSGLQF